MYRKSKKFNVILIAIVSVVLVIVTTGIAIAFFTDLFQTNKNAQIGKIEAGLYNNNGNTLISGYVNSQGAYVPGSPIIVKLSNTLNSPTNVDLWVKNTGNIDALVRITFAFYISNGSNVSEAVSELQVALDNSGWVNKFTEQVSAGQRTYIFESYYNAKITPNTPVRVITSLAPKVSSLLNADIVINATVDMIAYSGNAYKLKNSGQSIPVQDLPFGDLNSTFLSTWTAWQ